MAAYHNSNPPQLNCGTYGHRQCLPETCSYKFAKQDDQWWLDNDHPIKLVYIDEKGGTCKKGQFKMDSVGGGTKIDWPGEKYGCELNIPNKPGHGNPDYDRFVTWQNNSRELGKSYKNNFNKSPQTEYNGATLIDLYN